MLKRYIISVVLVSLLFSCRVSAQRIRFVYDYTSMPNRLQKDSLVKEVMVLEIDPIQKESVFVSYKKLKSDSNMVANVLKGNYLFPDSSVNTRNVIKKNLQKNEVFLYTANYAGMPVLKVEDGRNLDWKITNEKKEILSYPVQKATATFGERKWTAWFATKIPFSDGPYKFSGLPGLILRVSDATGSHSYELIGIEKINSTSYKLLSNDSYINARKTRLEDYKKMLLDKRRDPMKDIREKVSQGRVFFRTENEKTEYLRISERNLKVWKARSNNPIELDEIDIDDN
ncbi:GLPGLI family protein [Elizabethkingia meningoseptica]|uniref:GLPGLI family protein n=1 Tax=Elizabethkingia meningoseptica TaxID=238 RepID=UPI0038915DA0